MTIVIDDSRRLQSVQQEFSDAFRFLRLEFVADSRGKLPMVKSATQLVDHNGKTIGEFRAVHINGALHVVPTMTVSSLKKNLKDTFGLTAQVFRKSGNVWLETSLTDGWTIEQQNAEGEKLSVRA